MKMRKILALLLLLSMLSALAVGCASAVEETTDTTSEIVSSDPTSDPPPPLDPTLDKTEFPENLSAEAIGTLAQVEISPADGGVIYRAENGRYGILSLDGKTDTDVRYGSCEPLDRYFLVCVRVPTTINVAKYLNVYGLVDAQGKTVLSMRFADVQMLNERFVKVCTVSGQVQKSYEAVHCFTEEEYPHLVQGDPVYYRGTWEVFDLTTGKPVPNVGGTLDCDTYAYGNHILYTNDEKETVVVNAKGEPVGEGAKLLENGCYILPNGTESSVYNADGKLLFSYVTKDAKFLHASGDYFTVLAKGKYEIRDLTGKTVSAQFSSYPVVTGGKIYVDEKICNMDGTSFFKGSLNEIFVDKQLQHHLILRAGKTHTLLTKDGTVVCSGSEKDGIFFDTYHFLSYKQTDGGKLYYSLKDQDYTLKGTAVAPWLVQVEEENSTFALINVISGETILRGYRGYLCSDAENTAYYIYAKTADNGVDIFVVK